MADPNSRQGESYLRADILRFVDDTHAAHDQGLQQAFDAPDGAGMPAIQVGRSEGKLLELLARMVSARKIVEVGTLAGYSALRLARGLAPGGRVWTIEFEPEHAAVARERIAAAGMADRIDVLVGAGKDVLPTLVDHGPFDVVFVDADKDDYPLYGQWASANLRRGGLLIGDNAFLFGNLMTDTDRGRAMRTFHEQTARDFDSVCVPTPDGMVVGIRR